MADITVLEIQDGEFPMTDSEGRVEVGRRHLEPTHVFRSGPPGRVAAEAQAAVIVNLS